MSAALARFVTRRPLLVLVAVLLITCVPGYFAWQGLSVKVSLNDLLPKGAPNVELYQRFGAQFGGTNTVLVEVRTKGESIYDPDFLAKYKRIADDLYYSKDSIRYLNQSLALRKTKAISGSSGNVRIESIMWPDIPETDEAMQEFRRAVNNQYRGFLVSDDEKSAMIISEIRDDVDYRAYLDFLDALRLRESDEKTTVHAVDAVGRPLLLGEIYRALDDVRGILILSVLLVALILWLNFRSVVGIAVPLLTGGIATIWGLGAMGAVRYNLDPLLILLPAFVFAIVLSHVVQLFSRVLERLEAGEDKRLAIQNAFSQVLIPSTAAIITDAAGFLVLGLVAIPNIQLLAIVSGVWLLSIAPALTFATALLCLLPVPRNFRRHSPIVQKIWGEVVVIERHKYLVLAITLVLLAIGGFYTKNLKIGDAKGSAILWPDSRYNQDNNSINSRYSFLGADVAQVYIEGGDNTMLDPRVYHQTEAMDRFVYETVGEARPAQSLVPVIKLVHSVLYEGDPSYEIISDDPQQLGFDIYMFRSRGEPGDFSAYTDKDWRIGNINFFLQDHSADTIAHVTNAVNQFLKSESEVVSDAKFLCCGGQIGIVKAVNDEIKRANLSIMVAIAVIIALCVIAYYRSLMTGIVLLVSLATANFLTYALMAALGVGLNVSTLPLTALGVGLGVDYGIYMVDRIREEFRRTGQIDSAVSNALLTAGNAIFVTAMTMILPLLPWGVISPLRFQAEMGMLLGVVLFMNMLGALLFVPSALAVFKPKMIFSR